MRVISRKTLKAFYENPVYKDSKTSLEIWFRDAIKADWSSPNDIKSKFKNASILKNNRVVFNIHGNKYRLIVKIHYNLKTVFIRFVGTHEQYDLINGEDI